MEIRTRVMSALRWSAAARLLGQLVSWGITILVIRLLSPADYGLMAMAAVLVAFLFGLNTLGLDAVLVQEKTLTERTRRQVFGVVILANGVFFLVLYCGAGIAADFYGQSELAPLLQLLSVQFLLLIFETLPQSRLERDIDFARRSVVDFVTMILGSLTTLVLALLDFGVWALAWGMLVSTATRVAGLNLIARCLVWPTFSFRGLGTQLRFGAFVSTDRGLWFVFSESDKFIGGKLLGDQQLGYFAVASQLASLPIQKVSGLLNAIAFPAFSHVHAAADAGKVREYLLTATRILGIAAFPVFFGIACTADALVAVLLGAKWAPAAPLLQLLGLVMPFRLLSNVFPPLLWGIGTPATSATNYLFAALIMPAAFYVGARWGVLGLAAAWLAAYPVVFAFTAWRACRRVDLGLAAYSAELVRPLLGAAGMYAIVSQLGPTLPAESGGWPHLLGLIALGVAAYGLLMFLIDRPGLAETFRLLRS